MPLKVGIADKAKKEWGKSSIPRLPPCLQAAAGQRMGGLFSGKITRETLD